MHGAKRTHLQDLLSQQVQAANDAAIQAAGQVPAEQMEALVRLERLVDLSNSVRQQRKQWLVAAILFFLTLGIVSALLIVRKEETDIELDQAVSEVSFFLPSEQVVGNSMNLASLGIDGLREITVPRARDRAARTFSDPESKLTLNLSAASDGKRSGSITLTILALPAETRVGVRRLELPQEYELSLKGPDVELKAAVNGPVQIADEEIETLDFISPQQVSLQPGEEVSLRLTLSNPTGSTPFSQLSARDFSFSRIDVFQERNTVARRLSTILSGTLSFESLNGIERKFRSGEMIQFGEIRGEIRTLRLMGDQIELKFHGRVRDMSIGSGESQRTLMPSVLEWLQAQHMFILYCSTAIYAFGLIFSGLRWLRKPV